MATKTWYLTNTAVSVHQEISETDPGAEAYASPVTGWIVGTGAGPDYSSFLTRTERAASTFGATAQPDGSIDTTNGDCWRTTNTYTGRFATGDWVFHACVRANSSATGQDGRARFRLFRSTNADGSGATEITAAVQVGSNTVDLLTTVTQDSNVTVNISSFSVTNEYLFVQVGWERQGAASMSTADVNFRVGNGSSNGTRVSTPDFQPPQEMTPSAGVVTTSGVAPSLSFGTKTLTPDAKSVTVSVPDPTITIAYQVTPTAVSITSQAQAPLLSFSPISKTPSATSITTSSPNPTLTFGTKTVSPDATTISLAGGTVNLTFVTQITPDSVAAILSSPSVNVNVPVNKTPDSVSLNLSVPDPSVQRIINIQPSFGDHRIYVSVPEPTIQVGARRTPHIKVGYFRRFL